MSQNLWIHRNISVAQKFQSLFFHNDFKHFLSLITFQLILREEQLCNTVFSLSADGNSQFFTFLFKEFVGNLQKNTYTITGFSFRIFTCSVFQIFYNFQCIFHRLMALYTFAVHYGTDTAVIMFKLLTI